MIRKKSFKEYICLLQHFVGKKTSGQCGLPRIALHLSHNRGQQKATGLGTVISPTPLEKGDG